MLGRAGLNGAGTPEAIAAAFAAIALIAAIAGVVLGRRKGAWRLWPEFVRAVGMVGLDACAAAAFVRIHMHGNGSGSLTPADLALHHDWPAISAMLGCTAALFGLAGSMVLRSVEPGARQMDAGAGFALVPPAIAIAVFLYEILDVGGIEAFRLFAHLRPSPSWGALAAVALGAAAIAATVLALARRKGGRWSRMVRDLGEAGLFLSLIAAFAALDRTSLKIQGAGASFSRGDLAAALRPQLTAVIAGGIAALCGLAGAALLRLRTVPGIPAQP